MCTAFIIFLVIVKFGTLRSSDIGAPPSFLTREARERAHHSAGKASERPATHEGEQPGNDRYATVRTFRVRYTGLCERKSWVAGRVASRRTGKLRVLWTWRASASQREDVPEFSLKMGAREARRAFLILPKRGLKGSERGVADGYTAPATGILTPFHPIWTPFVVKHEPYPVPRDQLTPAG